MLLITRREAARLGVVDHVAEDSYGKVMRNDVIFVNVHSK